MSSSEKESIIQPDGSLLSLLGDLLFAVAIIFMIYPCLQRTVRQLDGQFFFQLFYIGQILLTVAALSFMMLLLVGQQMRIIYCSILRPYIGSTFESDKAYGGLMLKMLVCSLLLFNCFFARELQRWLGNIGHIWSSAPRARDSSRPTGLNPAAESFSFDEDALTNNSNTNSQTPVTQTQSVVHSDIFPSMSFPELSEGICPESAHTSWHNQRMYRDVGTMVRFSPELLHSGHCTLHLCSGLSLRPPTTSPIIYSSLPSGTLGCPLLSSSTPVTLSHVAGKSVFREQPLTSPCPGWDTAAGGVQTRTLGCGSGLVISKSSCHAHLNKPWIPAAPQLQPGANVHSNAGSASCSHISVLNEPPTSRPKSAKSSSSSSSSSSRCSSSSSSSSSSSGDSKNGRRSRSSQQSRSSKEKNKFMGRLELFSVSDIQQSPRGQSSSETSTGYTRGGKCFRQEVKSPPPPPPPPRAQSASPASVPSTTSSVSTSTLCPKCSRSTCTHRCGLSHAVIHQRHFLVKPHAAMSVHSHTHAPVICSSVHGGIHAPYVPVTCASTSSIPSDGFVPTNVYNTQLPVMSSQSRISSHPLTPTFVHSGSLCSGPAPQSRPTGQVPVSRVSSSVRAGGGSCVIQHHSSITLPRCQCTLTRCQCKTVIKRVAQPSPRNPRPGRRRFILPPMPKMTRSGKIYGYG